MQQILTLNASSLLSLYHFCSQINNPDNKKEKPSNGSVTTIFYLLKFCTLCYTVLGNLIKAKCLVRHVTVIIRHLFCSYNYYGLLPYPDYCSFFFLPRFFGATGSAAVSSGSASFTSESVSASTSDSVSVSSADLLLRRFTGSPADRS